MKALITIALSLSIFSVTVQAHPGRTAADGCHYCRTNCSSWGVTAGARHCHGGGLKPESQVEIMEKAASKTKEPEALEVTHSHGDEADHYHPAEIYN